MENSEKALIDTTKKTWSEPEITVLSVKDTTFGAAAGSPDATVAS